MIQDIETNNFRCFDSLKVSGCKRINLISGKNNVGKTALLEAIFLNNMPTAATLFSLSDLRRESTRFNKALPEKIWDNLFCKQDTKSISSIETVFNDLSCKVIRISIDSKKSLLHDDFLPKDWKDKREITGSIIQQQLYDESIQFVLSLDTKIDNDDSYQTIIVSRSHHVSSGTTPSTHVNPKYLQNSSFIPSALRASSVELTTEFDRARLNEKEDEVLKAFQIIDSSIVTVESFSIPEPTIYLKRQGEKRLPLSLFGDAMNRIADIILKIINNQDSILLIDEVENGIHHSNQIAFWDFLYRLAEQLNVQIFATTHSLEMTEAFIKAGLDRQDSAAHFELTRHEKTNKIVAISRDLETLEYDISHHKEVRGGA
jgi:AAA15 family ATPase/GTPase